MVSGVAWYHAEQWPRLLEVSVDRSELERTYDEWQAMAKKGLAELARAGVWARKVDVDVDELVEWCRSEGRRVGAGGICGVQAKAGERRSARVTETSSGLQATVDAGLAVNWRPRSPTAPEAERYAY